MNRSTKTTTLKFNTGLESSGLGIVSRALAVKSAVKAGGLNTGNHNRALAVKSAVKAGGLNTANHNRALK